MPKMHQNAPNSAWTRCGSLSTPPDPLAATEGSSKGREGSEREEGEGRQGREGWERGKGCAPLTLSPGSASG